MIITVYLNGSNQPLLLDVTEVTLTWNLEFVAGEDGPGLLQIKATDKGIATDVWCSINEDSDHNIATSSETTDELANRMVQNHS